MRERALSAKTNDDAADADVAAYTFVDRLIRQGIAADPMNKDYALHSPMEGMFRVVKGHLRVSWVTNEETREIVVVFISNRPGKSANAERKKAILKGLEQSGLLGSSILDDYRRAIHVPPNAPRH